MPVKVFSIAPTYSCEYSYFAASERLDRKQSKPPERIGTRQMSRESQKKLMNALQWLKLFSPLHKVYCLERKKMVEFKVNFITLTLSAEQMHSDAFIKSHMLEPFLKWMVRKGATCYVWKAEAQNNGNIHFHITGNYYIHWRQIRNKWNSLQEKHGYITEFFKTNDHRDPNSTDVHAVKKDGNIGNYLGKYFGKLEYWCSNKKNKIPSHYVTHPSRFLDACVEQDKPMATPKRQIDGRKWALSSNLVNIKCQLTERDANYLEDTKDFIVAQDYSYIRADFANIWFYPHLLDGKAPAAIADKLRELKDRVFEPI